MLLNPKLLAGIVLAFFLSNGLSWWVAFERGKASERLVCQKADTDRAEASLEVVVAQQKRDLANSVKANQALQRKINRIRNRAGARNDEIIALKQTIAGRQHCFDDEWLRQFNAKTD